ncbi:hypothetical protein PF008_g17450 [Phytophthora fragariae]|uniref:RNase H type-1 domain-containing protein n=2 Tax=Phytophthora fragariae TaxID=53985 RepID=A0A6G0R9E9_9STRA|nr:hypothetical protein PF008_g17450 [Phytophthora fragariae]
MGTPGAPPQVPSVSDTFPLISTPAATVDYLVAAFDGGCRHLTGRSAYAWCVWSSSHEFLHWEAYAFGDVQTNNAMEAQGFLSCLRSIRQRGRTTSVHVFGDSALIVGQALMQSDCNAVHLRPYVAAIRSLGAVLSITYLWHVRREFNTAALCNWVMDIVSPGVDDHLRGDTWPGQLQPSLNQSPAIQRSFTPDTDIANDSRAHLRVTWSLVIFELINGVAKCVPHDVFTTLRDTARRFDILFPMDSAFVAVASPPLSIPLVDADFLDACIAVPPLGISGTLRAFRGQTSEDPRPNKALRPWLYEVHLATYPQLQLLCTIATDGVVPPWINPAARRGVRPLSNNYGGADSFALVAKKDIPLHIDGRIIHDLSASPGGSVNDQTNSDASLDATSDPFGSIAQRVRDLRRRYPGYAIYAMVADFADAFHHVPVHADHASAFLEGGMQRSDHGIVSGMAVFGWTSFPGFLRDYERRRRIEEKTTQLKEAAIVNGTLGRYSKNFKFWEAFCNDFGFPVWIDELPRAQQARMVGLFAGLCASEGPNKSRAGNKYQTFDGKMAAVAFAHKAVRDARLNYRDPEFELIAQGYKRSNSQVERKQPVTTPMLLEMRRLLGPLDKQGRLL